MIRGPEGSYEQTRCVAQDVTAKHSWRRNFTRRTSRSRTRNAELSRKNRELDEFVYVVSHDLQEPLRTLTAFSDFLLQDHAGQLDSEGHEYVHRLVDASQRMRSMIQGLLNLSRAGKVTDEFGPVHARDLVADLRVRPGRIDPQPQCGIAAGQSGRGSEWRTARGLLQLLTNLVSNGIKYNTSAIPCVEIGTTVHADESPSDPGVRATAHVYVRDNGIGIDPRHHQRSSSSSAGSIPRTNTRGRESAWRSAARSPRRTAGASGWKALRQVAMFFVTLPPESALANSVPSHALGDPSKIGDRPPPRRQRHECVITGDSRVKSTARREASVPDAPGQSTSQGCCFKIVRRANYFRCQAIGIVQMPKITPSRIRWCFAMSRGPDQSAVRSNQRPRSSFSHRSPGICRPLALFFVCLQREGTNQPFCAVNSAIRIVWLE